MDPIIKYITNVEALKFLVRIISYVYDNSVNVVHCSWMQISVTMDENYMSSFFFNHNGLCGRFQTNLYCPKF